MGHKLSKIKLIFQSSYYEISSDKVEQLFADVKPTEDGLLNCSIKSQELKAIVHDENETVVIVLYPEATRKLRSFLKDESSSIPISISRECISIPTSQRVEAEPTSDTPAQARPKGRVEVVDPLPSGATQHFLSELFFKMEQHNMSFVDCTVQQLNEDENNNKPVLVVCNNHSRLRADIQNALANIKSARYERIILLVMHCQKEKHLPALTALSQLRDIPDFKVLRDVWDVAFDGDRGIYDCDMNRRAFDVFQDMSSKGLFSDKNDSENDESQGKNMQQKDERNQQKLNSMSYRALDVDFHDSDN